MQSKSLQIAEKVRDRLGERALAGAPQWPATAFPAARSNASALLIGTLLGRLPAEDMSALVQSILSEQNSDGSWSLDAGGEGDLSLTLEVVEAITTCGHAGARDALDRAVRWLEAHRHGVTLDDETLILLSAITDTVSGALKRLLLPAVRLLMVRRATQCVREHGGIVMPLALSILSHDRASVRGRERRLLELQLLDGSWEGSCRTTVFALAALRHTSLPLDDAAFDRGWRFLRGLQLWDGDGLVQNPCDASNLLHATALRALLVTDADQDVAAGSTLSLLHQTRTSGGWALGGMLPTDLMTTSLVLDALSFAGDIPVETSWARRRAVLLLLRTQNSDGGWPLCFDVSKTRFTRSIWHRNLSRVDVTAAAVQALAYSGVQESGEDIAVLHGVNYLLREQRRDGIWRGDVNRSAIFTTSRALEALFAASHERASRAVIKAMCALTARQRSDGGWSESPGIPSTPMHTAWVLRALNGAPGVTHEVITKGKNYLECSLDHSELMWTSRDAAWPVPFGEKPAVLPDLVTMWALEALTPAGIVSLSRSRGSARSRSIFDRSR